jgi:hypothetical protein
VEVAPLLVPRKDPVAVADGDDPPGSWKPSSPDADHGGLVLETMLYPENEIVVEFTLSRATPAVFFQVHLTVSASGAEVVRPVQLLVEVGLEIDCLTLPFSFPPFFRLVAVVVQGFSLMETVVVSGEVPPFLSGGLKVIVPVMPLVPD